MHSIPRSFLVRAALGAALLVAVATPAAGSQDRSAPAAGSAPAMGGVADGEGPLRNLPTSLLVTLGPGVGPGAADAMAASRGLVRVAWNPDLRTAQYVATDLAAAGTGAQEALAIAAATERAARVDARGRARLAVLGRDFRNVRGVLAARTPVRLTVVEDPTAMPTAQPTPDPVPVPTTDPTLTPVPTPDAGATATPSTAPSTSPTPQPSTAPAPTTDATPLPTADATPLPTADPGATSAPSPSPTPTPAPGGSVAPAAGSPIRLAPAADPTPAPVPTPTPVPAPNDTFWSSQWAPDAIGARSAWALTRGRSEIVVAVVDTGVDLTHPDLAGRLVAGTDLGDGDSNPTDENGHGTHVAGIIAALSDNALGVSGIAPRVFVLPLKVMDVNGDIWDTSVAEGIAWAVARGTRVINMSLGGSEVSPAIDAAIDDARAHGVVVVAAAGNEWLTNGVLQPAAYGPVVAVAAVEDRPASVDGDDDGLLDGCGVARFGIGDYRHAPYSNTGPEVDLAAPGSCILSTFARDLGGSYLSLSGTSMATPMVAAAAALVLSRNPWLTADEVEAALIGTAIDQGTTGPDPETGAGLLQAGAAVASVAAPASDGVNPTVSWTGITQGTLVRGTLSIRATVTDASPIVAVRVYRDGRPLYVRRSPGMSITWASTGVPDGLHTWAAYGTDAGLRVGSASVRVLVANQRPAGTISSTLAMTATARSLARSLTLTRQTPFVARVTGPSASGLVVRLVDASGRTVATSSGIGAATIEISSLRAGRYLLRASANSASPGLSLGLRAAWLR